MSETRCPYRKRQHALVQAVQLRLDTAGFSYEKWGSAQRCKAGDWLVDSEGEIYTVDADVFARTYASVSPGLYRKVTVVWAERAEQAGTVATKEGVTAYDAGDYVVYNDDNGVDGYAVRAEKFEAMYEPA